MKLMIPRFPIAETSLLRVDYVAYYQINDSKGKRRRKDCANLMKLLLDVVCARIGIDDSRVSCGSFDSKNGPEKIVVTLTEIGEVSDGE
jgi:Holliday junction resolvase RusA-like endonuclease